MLSGHWRKRADYNRRADSAKTALQGAIDYTQSRERADAAKCYPGEGEGSGVSSTSLDNYEYTIPDLLEPIIAYRAWGVSKGGILRPVTYSSKDNSWTPRTPSASGCAMNDLLIPFIGTRYENMFDQALHKIPGEYCTCGFYAANHFSSIMRTDTRYVAVGKVALWGKVVDHKKGYRAQYAYPTEFKIEPGFDYISRFNKNTANEIGHLIEENYGALFIKSRRIPRFITY